MAGKVDNVVHRFDGRRDSQLVEAWSLLVAISGSDTQLIPACCYVCQESYAKFVGAQSLLVAMYIKKASLNFPMPSPCLLLCISPPTALQRPPQAGWPLPLAQS